MKRRIHVACWLPKATNTHSDDLLLPTTTLRERISMLRLNLRCLSSSTHQIRQAFVAETEYLLRGTIWIIK